MKLLLNQGENPSAIKRKRTRPRKSKDRRLLEALMKDERVCNEIESSIVITQRQVEALRDIKQAMERKGGKS